MRPSLKINEATSDLVAHCTCNKVHMLVACRAVRHLVLQVISGVYALLLWPQPYE